MEKNNITPISCYSDSLVYEELNKEELKEAGVVIDYVGDEIYIKIMIIRNVDRGSSI